MCFRSLRKELSIRKMIRPLNENSYTVRSKIDAISNKIELGVIQAAMVILYVYFVQSNIS